MPVGWWMRDAGCCTKLSYITGSANFKAYRVWWDTTATQHFEECAPSVFLWFDPVGRLAVYRGDGPLSHDRKMLHVIAAAPEGWVANSSLVLELTFRGILRMVARPMSMSTDKNVHSHGTVVLWESQRYNQVSGGPIYEQEVELHFLGTATC